MANIITSGVFNLGSLGGDGAASGGDANWNDVVLLLDGSSVTDASGTNNFNNSGATPNATPSPDHPYAIEPVAFAFPNGAGTATTQEYLYSSAGAFDDLDNGDPFTIELWAKADALGSATTYRGLFGIGGYSTTTGLSIRTAGTTVSSWVGGASYAINHQVSLNTTDWFHIALVYDGSVSTLFVDGIPSSSTSSRTPTFGTNAVAVIGRTYGGTVGYHWNGQITEVRITKGVARYTADFSTDDVISNPAAWPKSAPVAGATKPTRRWGGITGRSLVESLAGAPVIDHSLRFDGTGDYLLWSDPSASNRRTNTLSFWFKPFQNVLEIFQQRSSSTVDDNQFKIQTKDVLGASRLRILDQTDLDGRTDIELESSSDLEFQNGTWYHLVVAVDTTQGTPSDRVKVWVNGQLYTNWSTATYPGENYQTGINRSSTQMWIAANRPDTGALLNRYADIQLAEYHFIDGQALTASDFGEMNASNQWVPKEVTGVTYGTNGFYLPFDRRPEGVTLLLDGSSPTDDISSINQDANLSVNGTVTATSIAGPSGHGTRDAIDLDGSSKFVKSTYYNADLYSQNFTIEGWFYIDALNGTHTFWAHRSQGNTHGVQAYCTGSVFGFVVGGNSGWLINVNGSTPSPSPGWHHIAITRSGNDYTMYVNGTSILTGASSGTVVTSGGLTIGSGSTTAEQLLDGKFMDFRITEGIARDIAADWTAGVYSSPLTNDIQYGSLGRDATTDGKGVTLLLDGSSTTDVTGLSTVTPSASGYSTNNNTSGYKFSQYIDMTGGFFNVSLPDAIGVSNEPFTVETWVYLDSNSGPDGVFQLLQGSATITSNSNILPANSLAMGVYNGNWRAYDEAGVQDNLATAVTGSWHHVALTYDGSTLRWFLNGAVLLTRAVSAISGGLPAAGYKNLGVGVFYNSGEAMDGRLEGFRITQGIARDVASGFSNGTPISGGGWDVALTNDDTWDKPQNNFAVPANTLTPDDQLIDSPNLRFATWDTASVNVTLSEANLQATLGGSDEAIASESSALVSGGKFYCELYVNSLGSGTTLMPQVRAAAGSSEYSGYFNLDGKKYGVSSGGYGSPYGATATIGCAVDATTSKIWWRLNGTWQASGDPASGSNPATVSGNFTGNPSLYFALSDGTGGNTGAICTVNFGQDHTFAGAKSPLTSPFTDDDGNGEFYYEPPPGFKALATTVVAGSDTLPTTGVLSLAEHYQSKL